MHSSSQQFRSQPSACPGRWYEYAGAALVKVTLPRHCLLMVGAHSETRMSITGDESLSSFAFEMEMDHAECVPQSILAESPQLQAEESDDNCANHPSEGPLSAFYHDPASHQPTLLL